MKIGILGSGLMGAKLGAILARAGHDVMFAYARSAGKLERLAREAGARAGTPREAAGHADVLFLAVHWDRMDDVLHQAGDLAGKIVLSCSLPMNEDESALVVGLTISGAEELARKIPGAHVVAAVNTVPSEGLFGVFASKGRGEAPDLVYCGDDDAAKRVAAGLIADVGFVPVDAGPLRIARYSEPFGLLMGQLAYEGSGGPEIAYRFQRFAAPA